MIFSDQLRTMTDSLATVILRNIPIDYRIQISKAVNDNKSSDDHAVICSHSAHVVTILNNILPYIPKSIRHKGKDTLRLEILRRMYSLMPKIQAIVYSEEGLHLMYDLTSIKITLQPTLAQEGLSQGNIILTPGTVQFEHYNYVLPESAVHTIKEYIHFNKHSLPFFQVTPHSSLIDQECTQKLDAAIQDNALGDFYIEYLPYNYVALHTYQAFHCIKQAKDTYVLPLATLAHKLPHLGLTARTIPPFHYQSIPPRTNTLSHIEVIRTITALPPPTLIAITQSPTVNIEALSKSYIASHLLRFHDPQNLSSNVAYHLLRTKILQLLAPLVNDQTQPKYERHHRIVTSLLSKVPVFLHQDNYYHVICPFDVAYTFSVELGEDNNLHIDSTKYRIPEPIATQLKAALTRYNFLPTILPLIPLFEKKEILQHKSSQEERITLLRTWMDAIARDSTLDVVAITHNRKFSINLMRRSIKELHTEIAIEKQAPGNEDVLRFVNNIPSTVKNHHQF